MLVRVLLLVLVAVIVMMVVRRFKVAANAPRNRASIDAQTVRCGHCQVYLPSNEAIARDGQYFCSRAHAEQSHPRP